MAALMNNCLTLRVLARLMAYPEQPLLDAVPRMIEVLHDEAWFSRSLTGKLEAFMRRLASRPVTELQEEYVALFDRGRALSLHLFEHVHGESRDRGQAMVDLLEHYRAGGLVLDARELPDYLPLMLEYLSTRRRQEADELLGDAMGVIVLIGARLAERGSDYTLLFAAIEEAVGSPAEGASLKRRAATEGPDPTIQRMDEIWQEEQVTFMGNQDPAGSCGAGRALPPDPIAAAGIAVRVEATADDRLATGNPR
ncbi:MAG: nitrate reductase molybdenum cofactor assembly chaperone [Gammaproteobacteria bacterium]|nr:MAG: nitrate reductase molybdenum cofactor assembly chaperone [Gammaproteobacteria bacterium]